jgi:uncharacterized protein DUF4412
MEAEGMWSDLMGEEITMRALENAIIATILMLFGQPVYAGVILSETEMQSGLGDSTTIVKTVYIQGKKQKIETSHDEKMHDEKIIDLEKGVLYEIDPNRKSYVRMAFPPKMEDEVAEANVKLSAVTLKKTGRSHSIDGYSCEEYRGIGRLGVIDVTVDQCMSQDAPGAREFANFQKEVFSRLKRRGPADFADSSKEGLPLEQSSSIKPRIPATSAPVKVTSVLMTTKTVVKNIQVRNLPSATFEPPAGFHMEAPRQETAIEVRPEA